jgi:predicted nucleic acid-binding protein
VSLQAATGGRLSRPITPVHHLALPRVRGREIDLAIAACALTLGARLWALNPRDFRDLPGLDLYPAS